MKKNTVLYMRMLDDTKRQLKAVANVAGMKGPTELLLKSAAKTHPELESVIEKELQ